MAYEYQYGDDDQVDYYLRRIERVQPGFYNNFRGPGGMSKKPSDAEITNYYYHLSARGAFYWVNDEEEERQIRREREESRSYQSQGYDSGEYGFGDAVLGLVGGLIGLVGLVGGLMFEEVEDEDDY